MPLGKIFDGVYTDRRKIYTKNLNPGIRVYGERLLREGNAEYREWKPDKSKLAAGIKNGLKKLPIASASNVLYLGAGEGTTISHISDIVGETGSVIGIDIGERSMKKFVWLAESRSNILPVLADAHNTNAYAPIVNEIGVVDTLFQDVAQPDQAAIFNANARAFIKPGRHGLLSIKAKSISQSMPVQKIFERETIELKKEWNILQTINLAPFETDHMLVHATKK